MVLLIIQKLILAGFLAITAWKLRRNDGREVWAEDLLRDMLKSRNIAIKILDALSWLATLMGVIFIPFAKDWSSFLVGAIFYILGIISHYALFEIAYDRWLKKMGYTD